MRNIQRILIPLLLCMGVVLFQIEPVSALSIRELLGLDKAEETQKDQPADKKAPAKAEPKPETSGAAKETPAEKNTWAKPSGEIQKPQNQLEFAYIQNVIANLNQNQRKAILADEKAFMQFIQVEADIRSVISAAIANKLDRDASTVFLMRRKAENILHDIYLNRLIATKIPSDFPTDQQVKEYYDNNKEKFVIGKRVHVWQIFLPIEKGMDKKAKAKLKEKAESIITDINKGKQDFAAAALKYSGHEASRNNGGYMGLIKVAELIPGIEKPLLGQKEGKLSKPIETETGIHILKRGEIVEEHPVGLAQVDAQIRQLLRNQASAQLRKAIYEQARKTYPIDLKDNRVEEWRLRLRTDLQANTTGSTD